MSARILGIDIGAAGALALVDEAGALLKIEDMPVIRDGPKNRPVVNPALLADIVREWRPGAAFIEYVGARPTDSKVGAFAFGRSKGVVEAVLATLAVPATWLTVPTWRRACGLPPGASKDAARGEALRRWPAHASLFKRVCDDGRAEAALIAIAGIVKRRA